MKNRLLWSENNNIDQCIIFLVINHLKNEIVCCLIRKKHLEKVTIQTSSFY